MSAKRRVAGSYFVSTLSIALVLVVVGILVFILLNARSISEHVKQNIGFSIIVKDNVNEAEIKKMQKILDTKSFVASSVFGNQQDDTYFTDIVIDILHQRFLIGHLLYHIISRQPLFNHHQRIVIGIQRIQLYLNGRQQEVGGVIDIMNKDLLIVMVVFVFVSGIFLSFISSWLSVRKYLNTDLNDLYG